MLTLYHAPNSRSDTVVQLVRMLNADVNMKEVTITRQDGTGAPDPANPHPEKKVPYLVGGHEAIRERGAMIVYLTDAYPLAKLGPLPGEPGRGAYLSWLFYYQGVMEPLIILHWAGLSHPAITSSLRDIATMTTRLSEALADGQWLLGDRFSAADMLCSSPFIFFPELTPDDSIIQSWVARCSEQIQDASPA